MGQPAPSPGARSTSTLVLGEPPERDGGDRAQPQHRRPCCSELSWQRNRGGRQTWPFQLRGAPAPLGGPDVTDSAGECWRPRDSDPGGPTAQQPPRSRVVGRPGLAEGSQEAGLPEERAAREGSRQVAGKAVRPGLRLEVKSGAWGRGQSGVSGESQSWGLG